MTDQNQLDALVAHIQRQRATMDRDTIRQRLLDAGAPPQLVDQALDQVYGSAPIAGATTSGPPAFESVSVDRIRAYLEQHKQTYTREALRDRLIQDGHNPQAVDLAIAQAYGFQVSSTTAPPETNRTRFVLTIVGVFLLNYIIWTILFVVGINNSEIGFAIVLWAVPIMLLVEGMAATVLRRRDRTLSRGLSWGIGLTVLPLVTLGLLFGICLAVLGGLY
ncbi:MAG TPA: hypothetical protein VGD58_09255 [Herpetosiphonaceae bacterium]